MATCNVCEMRIDNDLMTKHFAICDDDLQGGSVSPYSPEQETAYDYMR